MCQDVVFIGLFWISLSLTPHPGPIYLVGQGAPDNIVTGPLIKSYAHFIFDLWWSDGEPKTSPEINAKNKTPGRSLVA